MTKQNETKGVAYIWKMYRWILAMALLAAGGSIFAQPFVLPMNDLSRMRWERDGVARQARVHATDMPVVAGDVDITGIDGLNRDTSEYYYWITRKIFGEHLLELNKPGLVLHGDFIFDFAYGKETENDFGDKRNIYTNARGVALSAKIGDGVYVYTDFMETQARFAGYIDRYIDSLGVVPGSGRVKPFGEGAYDFGVANGYVAGSPTPWLHLMAGHYRQFIGAGQRSLLLSDRSFNYPFASYTLRPFDGKLQYRYTLALLQSLNRLPLGDTPESIFERKYSAQHYLSFKPTSTWEIGLFEATVWDGFDDTTGTRPFPFEALVPVPGYNAARLGLETPETKSIIGLNAAWQPLEFFRLYGQWVVGNDDFDKTGHQLGAQVFRLFGRLDLQLEYNAVDRGVYGSPTDDVHYSHYNQPLAHPLDSGFEELYTEATYYYGRWYGRLAYLRAIRDGLEIDIPNHNIDLVSVPTRNIDLVKAQVAYVFNPFSNLELYVGYTFRSEKRPGDGPVNSFYYFGLRTALRNFSTNF